MFNHLSQQHQSYRLLIFKIKWQCGIESLNPPIYYQLDPIKILISAIKYAERMRIEQYFDENYICAHKGCSNDATKLQMVERENNDEHCFHVCSEHCSPHFDDQLFKIKEDIFTLDLPISRLRRLFLSPFTPNVNLTSDSNLYLL